MTGLLNYKKHWAKRFEDEKKRERSLLEWLRRSASDAAKILVEQFKAKKVYLYGSVADGDHFHKHSDVDLAVEGLPSKKYISALTKIYDIFQGKSRVDLLPLEDIAPKVRKKIEKEGKLLYGEI